MVSSLQKAFRTLREAIEGILKNRELKSSQNDLGYSVAPKKYLSKFYEQRVSPSLEFFHCFFLQRNKSSNLNDVTKNRRNFKTLLKYISLTFFYCRRCYPQFPGTGATPGSRRWTLWESKSSSSSAWASSSWSAACCRSSSASGPERSSSKT